MRTVLLIIAISLMDIARTNGKIYSDDAVTSLTVVMVIVMIMDVVDFFRGE